MKTNPNSVQPLSIREQFASMALQGLLAGRSQGPVTAFAVSIADALVADLNRPQNEIKQLLEGYTNQAKKLADDLKHQAEAKKIVDQLNQQMEQNSKPVQSRADIPKETQP